MIEKYRFEIGEKDVGLRVDLFLSVQKNLSSLAITRTRIQALVKDKKVLVNGKSVKSHYSLRNDDVVEIVVPDLKESAVIAEDISLDIIYEDKDVIVVNKAAGMVVHPTDSGHNQTGTLVNALLFHCDDLSGIGGVMRPGIVHRLDKGTSGVLIVAKNDKAHQILSNQIKERKVKKIYLTLLKGRLEPETGSIDSPIGRSLIDRKKMAVVEHGASRNALTHYKVLKYFTTSGIGVARSTYSLVEVEIVTGRTHQIRVHFQAIGHPVVGDETYGDSKVNKQFKLFGLRRPFLHARRLSVRLPSSGEVQTFEAELSDDLENVISRLDF